MLQDKGCWCPTTSATASAMTCAAQGFDVQVLTDREWMQLSPRIRVMCIPDVNQDAVLLVDVGGRLVVNLNDAGDRGWGRFVRKVIRGYQERSCWRCPATATRT